MSGERLRDGLTWRSGPGRDLVHRIAPGARQPVRLGGPLRRPGAPGRRGGVLHRARRDHPVRRGAGVATTSPTSRPRRSRRCAPSSRTTEFPEALEALADEAAARHLGATGALERRRGEAFAAGHLGGRAVAWRPSPRRPTGCWASSRRTSVTVRSTRQRSRDRRGGSGSPRTSRSSPVDAQEQFLKKLVTRSRRSSRASASWSRRGSAPSASCCPLGKLFGVLKQARAARCCTRAGQGDRASCPSDLQPIARTAGGEVREAEPRAPLAAPLTADAGAACGSGRRSGHRPSRTPPTPLAEGESPRSAEALADEFDARLAEAILAPNEAAATELARPRSRPRRTGRRRSGHGPLAALDAGPPAAGPPAGRGRARPPADRRDGAVHPRS